MLNQFELSKLKLKRPNLKWVVGLGIALMIGTGLIALRLNSSRPTSSGPTATPSSPFLPTVNALGRLEPQGKVINVSAPSQSMGGSQVIELRVKEGDRVQAGQILAALDSRDRLQASLLEAQQQVQVARSRLEDIRAGAKRGEITAAQAEIQNLEAQLAGELKTQQATIDRLKAELQNAEIELQRNQLLSQEGAIATSTLDSRKLAVKTAQERLNEAIAASDRTQRTLTAQIQKARATLSQTAEVRPTDIRTAQAEIDRAIAAANLIQVELNQSCVRAPKAGRVLKINTQVGEIISSNGIVELAATDQMIAIAEIYESDISRVQQGQTAIITSPSNVFPNQLRGTVQQLGSQIAKKDILNTDPTAATDARVIEVKIQLDPAASKQVANLINLQVNVELQP
ncbi:ABC exporter membrane fusion protein [Phormidium sp. CLA17]|nr:ABC exporter membrane fusion protein [Leptolyngbya sp. Cla-17]